MPSNGLIPDPVDHAFTRSVAPLIRRLVLARINPNAITLAAFAFTAAGGVLIARSELGLALACVVLGGVLDFSDGKVAALTDRVTLFGGVLDSVLDRYADTAVYLGLMVLFAGAGQPATGLAAAVALAGSMITSYLLALGKTHGHVFRAGILRRQDRVVLVGLGLLMSANPALPGRLGLPALAPLDAIVWLLAILTNVTALQRLAKLRRLLSGTPPAADPQPSLRERQLDTLRHLVKASSDHPTGGVDG
jgi:CDP-diacylglycerol--glycerol-3-phosphate 3-phosphatidyltransferase